MKSNNFVSSRSIIGKGVVLGKEVFIYGATRIGANTLIDSGVTLGYPTRQKVLKLLSDETEVSIQNTDFHELLDRISDGVEIGQNCIIRRGTIIYENVKLGNNCETGHNVLIREHVSIGDGCKIGSYTIIDGYVSIGSNTVIQSAVYIPPKVIIGSGVFIAPRVVFTNDRYPPSSRLIETVIEDDAVIGANATIVAGIRIGKGAVIAAGSVVTKSVEPYTVVAGIPAKPIMTRDEYERRKKEYEKAVSIFPWR
ncbi:MAG: N-acetyltransferase [Ignisphaera sp.]|nr:N-acetyltransferase [Ignisphaera sp.]